MPTPPSSGSTPSSATSRRDIPWDPADGRWTRVHRARCLRALGRGELAAREVAPVRASARERVLARALAEVLAPRC